MKKKTQIHLNSPNHLIIGLIFFGIIILFFLLLSLKNFECKYFFNLDIITKSIIATISLWILLWLILLYDLSNIRKKSNNRNFKFIYIITRPHQFQKYSFWISLLWSLVFILVVLIVLKFAYLGTDVIKEENITGYIIGIVASFLIGFWSLLIAFVIRSQQRTDFSGMEKFLLHLADIFMDWYSQYDYCVKYKDSKEFYLLDYHPLIGSISLVNEDTGYYKAFKSGFGNLKDISVKVRIICYDDSNCSQMFELLKSLKPEIPNTSKCFSDINEMHFFDYDLIDYCKSFEKRSNNIAIWHTTKINPLHFIIADNKAFQYSVIPVENNGERKNVLMGFESEDVFQIEFLRSTFKAIERFAVTPDIELENDIIILKFEKQINIQKIKFLKPDKRNEFNEIDFNSNMNNNVTCIDPTNFNNNILKDIKININFFNSVFVNKNSNNEINFIIKLVKINDIESVESELIKIEFPSKNVIIANVGI